MVRMINWSLGDKNVFFYLSPSSRRAVFSLMQPVKTFSMASNASRSWAEEDSVAHGACLGVFETAATAGVAAAEAGAGTASGMMLFSRNNEAAVGLGSTLRLRLLSIINGEVDA